MIEKQYPLEDYKRLFQKPDLDILILIFTCNGNCLFLAKKYLIFGHFFFIFLNYAASWVKYEGILFYIIY